MGGPIAHAERAAVRRRAHDAANGNRSSGARHVLDDERLTERYPHPLGDDAREAVGRPTWCKADHNRDRA